MCWDGDMDRRGLRQGQYVGRGTGSSVGIATDYGLEGLGIEW